MPKKKLTKTATAKKYKKAFKDLDPKIAEACSFLVDNAAFMHDDIEGMKEKMVEEDYVTEWNNGRNQSGVKGSPIRDEYHRSHKEYLSTMKYLIDKLPQDKREDADELMEYIKG